MDCDLSHPPEAIPRLLAASADADLVLGSRYVAGRRRRRLAGAPARDLAGRLAVRPRPPRRPGPRPDGRVQVLPPAGCSRRSTSTACTARATSSRSSSPTARCGWAAAWSRCRSRSPTAPLGHSKMTPAIVLEAVWKVPRAAPAGDRADRSDGPDCCRTPLAAPGPCGTPGYTRLPIPSDRSTTVSERMIEVTDATWESEVGRRPISPLSSISGRRGAAPAG